MINGKERRQVNIAGLESGHGYTPADCKYCWISDIFQQVVFEPSRIGWGNMPFFTQSQMVDFETGTNSRTCFSLNILSSCIVLLLSLRHLDAACSRGLSHKKSLYEPQERPIQAMD